MSNRSCPVASSSRRQRFEAIQVYLVFYNGILLDYSTKLGFPAGWNIASGEGSLGNGINYKASMIISTKSSEPIPIITVNCFYWSLLKDFRQPFKSGPLVSQVFLHCWPPRVTAYIGQVYMTTWPTHYSVQNSPGNRNHISNGFTAEPAAEPRPWTAAGWSCQNGAKTEVRNLVINLPSSRCQVKYSHTLQVVRGWSPGRVKK